MAMQISIQLAAVSYEYADSSYTHTSEVKAEMQRRKEKQQALAISEVLLDGQDTICVLKTYTVKWNPSNSTYTCAILRKVPQYKSVLAHILNVEEERIVSPYQKGDKKCEWPLEIYYRLKDGLWRRPDWKEYSQYKAENYA